MKLIIDIDEKKYNTIRSYPKDWDEWALNAIKNGTPLPTGHWIYTGDYITDGMLKCSQCGFEHDVLERFLYCPTCGVKMESEE